MKCAERGSSPSLDPQQLGKRFFEDLLSTMDKRCLVKDFACILCQRICNTPVATTVCMHRFCESCMSPRIAVGNLRCPRCNMQLDQNQPVCHDSNFQDIIEKIDFDLNTVHDLCTRKPHSTSSDEEYMDMCNVSEERRKIIRKKTSPQGKMHPLAVEHAFYWDRKFQGSNALVQRCLKRLGRPHHDPPLPLPSIPEHDGGEVEGRRPFRIYGNLISHVPPPLRDKRIRDGAGGSGWDAEYKLFECNKDHVWPVIEKREPNKFGITAEYRKSLAKMHRMLRSKSRIVGDVADDRLDGENDDEKPIIDVNVKQSDSLDRYECDVDAFLEMEANGESSSSGSLNEDVNDSISGRQHLFLNRLTTQIVEIILRPNRNPKVSSRLISTRELQSLYLFVDEDATVAHLQQFVMMRTISRYPKADGRVCVLISPIIWECKAARLAMLQCIRQHGKPSPHISPLKGSMEMSEMEALTNSTAYSITTKDGESTVYASEFPVQRLNEKLRLSEIGGVERKSIISLLYTVSPYSVSR